MVRVTNSLYEMAPLLSASTYLNNLSTSSSLRVKPQISQYPLFSSPLSNIPFLSSSIIKKILSISSFSFFDIICEEIKANPACWSRLILPLSLRFFNNSFYLATLDSVGLKFLESFNQSSFKASTADGLYFLSFTSSLEMKFLHSSLTSSNKSSSKSRASLTTALVISVSVSPSKGGHPETNTYANMPHDQTSDFSSYPTLLSVQLYTTSGAT